MANTDPMTLVTDRSEHADDRYGYLIVESGNTGRWLGLDLDNGTIVLSAAKKAAKQACFTAFNVWRRRA